MIDESRLLRPARILLLGAPGVGKGTFASRLGKNWRIPHIATGDVIRHEIQRETPLGLKFKDFANKGMLVPDEMVNEVAKHRLSQLDVVSNGYILDGYPRTLQQAEYLATIAAPQLCINLNLPDRFLIEKVAGRRVCVHCNYNYNIATIKEGPYNMPPLMPKDGSQCDNCGQPLKLFTRDDDKVDVVAHRLQIYKSSTAPLIDYYSKLGLLRSFEVYTGVADLPDLADLILTSMVDVQKRIHPESDNLCQMDKSHL